MSSSRAPTSSAAPTSYNLKTTRSTTPPTPSATTATAPPPAPETPATPMAASPTSPTTPQLSRNPTNSSSTSAASRLRSASLKLIEADVPPGMWAATGRVLSRAPLLPEIRRGEFGEKGWDGGRVRAGSIARRSTGLGLDGVVGHPEAGREGHAATRPPLHAGGSSARGSGGLVTPLGAAGSEPFPNLVGEESRTVVPTDSRQTLEMSDALDGAKDDKSAIPTEGNSSTTTHAKMAEKGPRPINGEQRQYANGYIPPPKLPWTTSTKIGLKAFSKWVLTPSGFLITAYGLNVVAWGGMLFLLLCNAAPAMCHPTCDDIQSPRRKWVEVDSQILNALFCVTGFGLAPWRARDVWWWGVWRFGGHKKRLIGIRRLAGIHRGWFRLPGSDELEEHIGPDTFKSSEDSDPDLDAGLPEERHPLVDNPAVPIPVSKIPDPPPTGIRASPTKSWKMDFVVWMNMWNTFFQIVLCFYMWHYNRYLRPSWATGLFVALGSIVAGVGGIMMFVEGRRVKAVEGVPEGRKEFREKNGIADLEAQTGTRNGLGGEQADGTNNVHGVNGEKSQAPL